ncbi:hypothetical protein GCM10022393_30060 [Aquimarina addita]|uniref:Uncharacterized protein n=1 Tax=Aquimarina addita TaxID=870485 RepID=A0ABP6UNN6_9FLAO
MSLNVPPPIAVTKAIIKIPKTSNFLFIALKAPETAKAIVPKISSKLKKVIFIKIFSKIDKIRDIRTL